jgi:hypothetical protein
VNPYAKRAAGAQAATPLPIDLRDDFSRRTANLVIDRFRRGLLEEAVLVALLAGVGLSVDEGDSR